VEFIPILETSGLIHQVGERVLAEACSQLADWRRQLGLTELAVAVNLSVHQLEHPRLAERIDRILTSAGLPPSALVLEFRGDALGPAHPGSSEVLAALASGGVRLALDDFGVGWLSLQRLRGVKLEWLKLEREFVQGLPVDAEDCLVADAALALAGLLRAELVAEAVESPAQLDYLVQRGCRLAQGFLFSPPVSADELPDLLTRNYGGRHLASAGA
jgi:EAL domain-containing protein (putative c-di-GMP-specific phosphodiesterase class I)